MWAFFLCLLHSIWRECGYVIVVQGENVLLNSVQILFSLQFAVLHFVCVCVCACFVLTTMRSVAGIIGNVSLFSHCISLVSLLASVPSLLFHRHAEKLRRYNCIFKHLNIYIKACAICFVYWILCWACNLWGRMRDKEKERQRERETCNNSKTWVK